eukprot:COSAG02_NODE_285_length_25646_cov_10.858143_6_plen_91_part_00
MSAIGAGSIRHPAGDPDRWANSCQDQELIIQYMVLYSSTGNNVDHGYYEWYIIPLGRSRAIMHAQGARARRGTRVIGSSLGVVLLEVEGD